MRRLEIAVLVGVSALATSWACAERDSSSGEAPRSPNAVDNGASSTTRGETAEVAGAAGEDSGGSDADVSLDSGSGVGGTADEGGAMTEPGPPGTGLSRPRTRGEDASTPGEACEPVGEVSLFDCNVELCVPADIVAVEEHIDPEQFHLTLQEILSAWIDESCFEVCEPSFEETCDEYQDCESATCTEADCTTDRGAILSYTQTEHRESGSLHENRSYTARQTVAIEPASGDATFSQLSYTLNRSIRSDDEHTTREDRVRVSWVGTLRPDWPSDFSGEFEIWEDDYYPEFRWEIQHERCDMAYYRDDFSDVVGSVLSRSVTRGDQSLWVGTYRVDGAEWPVGTLNDECLGEVDPQTLELVGPCP